MQEYLTCERCWRTWSRTVVRGRKPSFCPNCRPAPARRRTHTARPTSNLEL